MKRILLLMFLGLFVLVNAQTTNPKWKTYLEGYEIEYIADAGNYLWMTNGTEVIKFDKATGNAVYYSLDGVVTSPEYHITSIACKENDLPYIGVDNTGVLKLNEDKKWTVLPLPESEINYVGDILITDTDTLWTWMLTPTPVSSILVRYQGNTVDTFTTDYLISSIAEDNDGNLWIGKLYGIVNDHYEPLVKYDGENWTTFNAPLELGPTPMWIFYATFDKLGNLWMAGKFGLGFGHEEKLIRFDNKEWQVYYVPDGWITSLALQDNSIIWLVVTKGLLKFSNSEWTVYDTENSDLPTIDINSIVIDDYETKWLGTANGLVAFNENGLLSTDSYSQIMDDIVLYPNPARDFINLKIPEGLQKVTVDIFNIQGRSIKTFSINNQQNLLDVSHLTSGIYLVRIQSDENYTMKKFVKY